MKREIICIICSLFCFAYGLLIFSIRSGSRFYLVWAAAGFFILGLAFFLHYEVWGRLPSGLQKTITVVIIIGVLLFLAVEACIFSGFGAKGEADLDYIIVLGAQVKENGPSIVLRYRLDAAYDYLVENGHTICIVSGGQGTNEPCSEAQGMYDYLVEKGISPERILMEDRSVNTSQNIAFSAVFLDREKSKVGIVTNNFHVFRGVQLAKHQGIKNVCGIAARSNVLFLPNNMVREFFGILKDFICGNLI